MTIDTNIGLTYNENYPTAGIDQSSQGFRDNFLVLKRAIENLQGVSSTASSVLALTSSIGNGGAISVALSYRNNAFVLPTGSPSVPESAGMLRHTSGIPQIHDGNGWRTVLTSEPTGGIRLNSTSFLKLPSGFTADRPTNAEDGMVRFNATLGIMEIFRQGVWTGVGQTGNEINSTGGTITGFLNLSSDAVLPEHALNFRSMKKFFSNLFTPVEHGVNASFNSVANSINFSVQPFNIDLQGMVTGHGTVNNLGDAIITTTIPSMLTLKDVRDEVGQFVKGTSRLNQQTQTETGITVNYDQVNNTLEIGARDFTIDLTGAVRGSGTVSKLGNVSIATTSDLITGLSAYEEGLSLGLPATVKGINFIGNGITASQSGSMLTVTLPDALDVSDVRDTVGSFITGTIRDAATQVPTESGIFVNYDAENNTLELAPRQFTISLTGAVTGSAKVTRLNNVAINTTSEFIRGIAIKKQGVLLGSTINTLDIYGANAVVQNGVATITVDSSVNVSTINSTVATMLAGSHHSGVTVAYDSANKEIDIAAKPVSISLLGAVTGNGTVTYSGNSAVGEVTIETHGNDLGIEVRDEGSTAGVVRAVNFVGGGISTAVSIDGSIATVFVPNSPANEKFLLIDNGSANVPNARKFVGGTGIILDDGGPGVDFTISASSDAIIAKSRFILDGVLVAERSQINVLSTDRIYPELVDNPDDSEITLRFFDITDGWYRPSEIDLGLITDRYGPSIDMGTLERGIIETNAEMGLLV